MSLRTLTILLLGTLACELPGKNLGDPNSTGDEQTTGGETSVGTSEQTGGDGQTSSPPDTTGGEQTGGEQTGSTGNGSGPPEMTTGGGEIMCALDQFPKFDKQCAVPEDCAAVLHQVDCCGSLVALGFNKGELPEFEAAEAFCAIEPICDCAPQPTVSEDGEAGEQFVPACVEGVCKAVPGDPCEGVDLPPCPPECPDQAPALCGQPCDMEGDACGNNIGDGMVCTGGTWQCSVHPPLGPGCNLVCK